MIVYVCVCVCVCCERGQLQLKAMMIYIRGATGRAKLEGNYEKGSVAGEREGGEMRKYLSIHAISGL